MRSLITSFAALLAVILLAQKIEAQQEAQVVVASAINYMTANSKTAWRSGGSTFLNDYSISADACILRLHKTSTSSTFSAMWDYLVDLRLASPEVEEKPNQLTALYEVSVVTTSGEGAFTLTSRVSPKPATPQPNAPSVSIDAVDRPTADTIANRLSGAIRACGGQPRSMAAMANANLAKAAAKAHSDSVFGNNIPEAVRADAREACYSAIRERLKAPGSARFDSQDAAFIIPTADRTGLLVSGSVEAQNELGGFKQSHYSCSLNKYGKQYVMGDALIY